MTVDLLLSLALQSGALFLAIWAIFRLYPSVPASAKAWIWRIAFLKPLIGLLPMAAVTLHVLPVKPSVFIHVEEEAVTESAVFTQAPQAQTTSDPLLSLWFLGAGVVAAYGALGWLKAARMTRRATPVTDPALLASLCEITARAEIRRPVRLLSSSEVPGAMLVGGFRPIIILPSTAGVADRRLMLAHEIAHIARKDLAWYGVIWAVQSLFFFNPAVWLAARCARQDHESATDADAFRLAQVPIQTYADMLLRATVVARGSLVPGMVPMAESYRTIHRRLEAMKHFHTQPSLWRKTAIGAIALVTAGLIPSYRLAEAQSTTVQGYAGQAGASAKTGTGKISSSGKATKTKTTKRAPKKGSGPKQGSAVKGTLTAAGGHGGKAAVGRSQGAARPAGSKASDQSVQGRAGSGTISGQGISAGGAGYGVRGQHLPGSAGSGVAASGQGLAGGVGGQGVAGGGQNLPGGGVAASGGVGIGGGQNLPGSGGAAAGGAGIGGGQSLPGAGGGVGLGGQNVAGGPGGIGVNRQGIPGSVGTGSIGGGQGAPGSLGGQVGGGSVGFVQGGGATLGGTAVGGRPGHGSLSGRAGGSGFGSLGGSVGGTGFGSQGALTRRAGSTQAVAKVSMSVQNVDLRTALETLFAHGKRKYRIDSAPIKNVTLTVENVSFETALRALLESANAVYRLQNGMYVISAKM